MSTARKAARTPRWQELPAGTPDEQLAVAYDRLRAGLAHLRRNQRDAAVKTADRELANSIAGEAARILGALADRIDERKAASSP